jgi:superfamily II DNA or RNA helicase
MGVLEIGVGARVRVRRSTWVIEDVERYAACRVLTLAADRADNRPRLRVIHPFDDVEVVAERKEARRVSGRRWHRACRALLAASGEAAALRTAAAARIDLLPYQLEPALALLMGLGTRVLLADEVGLGKTVQAMLAAAELHARGIAARVLVLCPAGLREQWLEEWSARFGQQVALMDFASVRRLRAMLPPGVNPWTTEPLAVASLDYVKRPEVFPLVLAAHWDMVVVDEAHGASGGSDRGDAVARVCARASYVLLLTATPHNGDERAFTSLCGFGGHGDQLVVFRRSRKEAGRDAGRRVHTLRVVLTEPERRMHAALAAFTRAVRRERSVMDRHAWLMISLLHKRALSSAHALAASVERRLRLLEAPAADGPDQLLLPLDDETGELDAADAAPMWGEPALSDVKRERRLLEHLYEAARAAEGRESKLRRLCRLLRVLREPALVFTEYRDTLLHVRAQVAPHAVVVHGGMTQEQRQAALASFDRGGVLLATDAAGEGLNLQRGCRLVVNLELPWNPMRLEQRIGRVDRIGQRRRVHVFNLVSEASGEIRLLERLAARVSEADARIGAPNPFSGRAEWTEEASARVVVLRQARAPTSVAATSSVPLTRLDAEAARESTRIGEVRRLLDLSTARPHVDSAVPDTTLVTHTRRAASRTALRRRVLVLLRSRLLDRNGHIVAQRVDGALADMCPAPRCEQDPDGPLTPVAASAGYRHWLDTSLRDHARMTTMRADRLRKIAAMFEGNGGGERQPGLFDRRAEHAWAADDRERRDALDVVHERLRQAESMSIVSIGPPEPALLLVPRERKRYP